MPPAIPLAAALERSGLAMLAALHEAAFVVRFAYAALSAAMTPSIWRLAARGVTIRQIHHAAVDVLPWFIAVGAAALWVLKAVLLGFAQGQGFGSLGLELILRALPLEVIPFGTALFVALRSGASISAEIAIRRSRREFERLEAEGGDVMREEFIPRILACAFSVAALTAIANALSFVLTYLVMFGPTVNGFDEFTLAVGHVFSLPMSVGLAVKCALFGVLVAVVPIATAIAAPAGEAHVPSAVARCLVRLFIAIGALQALSLAAKYV